MTDPTEDPESSEDVMLVDCRDCDFEERVTLDEDPLPGHVLREHGRETNHSLDLVPTDE